MWATREQARAEWADAPTSDSVLDLYLSAAQDACVEYAPVLAEGQAVPARYTLAVIAQARDTWQALRRNGDLETMGDAAYPVRVRPLSDAVKQQLRPQSAVPRFGGGS